MSKFIPGYDTSVKPNIFVLETKILGRKTDVHVQFILLQGASMLALLVFILVMRHFISKFFQLCCFFPEDQFVVSQWHHASFHIADRFFSNVSSLVFSDDSPLRFPLLPKVVRDRFLLDHWKIDRTASFFQDGLLSFSIFANRVILLAEMHRADSCVVCESDKYSLVSANFGNPTIFLLLFLGKTMKSHILVLLWVSSAKGNTAVVGHFLFSMNISYQNCLSSQLWSGSCVNIYSQFPGLTRPAPFWRRDYCLKAFN